MRGAGARARAGRAPAILAGVALALASALPARSAPITPPHDEIPTPESVLGFRPGADRHLADWDQVLAYLARLDAASARVKVEEIGKTTQGRPFVLATVTSEANHRRLEEIRQANLHLADPRGLPRGEAERLVNRGRAIVAMAFSIHSTEVGGTLTSLLLLHHLAIGDTLAVRRVLDETVLLVLPSQNPDGTQLVAEWYRRQLGTPFEGAPPPVLYHQYVGHDNNRDWYAFTQAETRLTVEHVHRRWHPQTVSNCVGVLPRISKLPTILEGADNRSTTSRLYGHHPRSVAVYPPKFLHFRKGLPHANQPRPPTGGVNDHVGQPPTHLLGNFVTHRFLALDPIGLFKGGEVEPIISGQLFGSHFAAVGDQPVNQGDLRTQSFAL